LWLVSGLSKPASCVERDAHQQPPDHLLLCKVTSPRHSWALQPSLVSTQRLCLSSRSIHVRHIRWSHCFQAVHTKLQRNSVLNGISHIVPTKMQQGTEQPNSRRPRGLSQDPFTAPAALRLASAALGTGSVRTAE